MKNVLSLTPGSISIISDKRELAGMGEIRMEEKRHSFFVKNTNLFVGVDFIYKHTHTHTHTHTRSKESLYLYICKSGIWFVYRHCEVSCVFHAWED